MSINTFTAIDFETAQGKAWSICQVGIVRVENGKITEELDILVRPPENYYFWRNTQIHGITARDTASAPTFDRVYTKIRHLIEDQDVVAHNINFDARCLEQALQYYDIAQPEYTKHCTYKLYKKKLNLCCEDHNIQLNHHDALSDSRACAKLFMLKQSV